MILLRRGRVSVFKLFSYDYCFARPDEMENFWLPHNDLRRRPLDIGTNIIDTLRPEKCVDVFRKLWR